MISQVVAERVLTAALQTGGDFAEIFLEDTERNSIALRDGTVETATYARVCGAGVRVFYKTRCVYATTADVSEQALLATARAAAAALSGTPEGGVRAFAVHSYAVAPQTPFSAINNQTRIGFLKRGYEAAKAESGEITQVSTNFADVDQRVLVCNSEGLWAEDRRPRVRYIVQAVAMQNNEAQIGYSPVGFTGGFETIADLDVERHARHAARVAVTMLHAPECPAGFMPVVIDAGGGGTIFHEACGHSLEATAVAKGNSEFCGKLGQKIAADCVSAYDDGTMLGEYGFIRMDDEGMPARRNLLIENGILKGYLVDRMGARLMGTEPTASSRRQSYEYAPTSRMTNTFIAAGTDDEEEMIRTMGEGLFAKAIGGGSVNPLTGEFNFAVEEGYYVKNGEIVSPVRGATLVGKGSDVLMNIDRVGRELRLESGMCGSQSGWVPVCVGQPRIRVSGMTVGGKGGAL